ncbi:MAG: multiprotein bridging factor aMBF1 [Nanoarchaeota archaeon]
MICDMCGDNGKLYKVIVEGAELALCKECSKFGKVMGAIQQDELHLAKKAIKEAQPENIQLLVEDYAEKIKRKREQLGLSQKELAERLNEKESVLQKIESGHFEPPIDTAKKIEKLLNIKIIEEREEKYEDKGPKARTETFTIGDFIKIKK